MRYAHERREFRRVLFRSPSASACAPACSKPRRARVSIAKAPGLSAPPARRVFRRRSEERREGMSVSVRGDLGGRRIIKKKTRITSTPTISYKTNNKKPHYFTKLTQSHTTHTTASIT